MEVGIKNKYKNIVTQILIWCIFFAISLFTFFKDEPFQEAVLDSIIETISIMVLVYVNAFWLIKKYLYKKRFVIYASLFLAFTLFIILIRTILVSALFDLPLEYEMIWLDFSYFFFVTIAISSVWIIIDQYKVKGQLIAAEKSQVEAQLKFLKAQTNPHFLFNVLNSINFLIQKDTDKASDVLMKLSEMLRYQIYDTDIEKIDIKQEVNHLKNYIELEKVRMGKRLMLETNFSVIDNSVRIAPFLFLPLIENAFKHSSSTGISTIRINMIVNAKEIQLIIENSCPAGTQRERNNIGGLGLENLAQRLELLYPKRHQLNLEKKDKKYFTKLILNLDKL